MSPAKAAVESVEVEVTTDMVVIEGIARRKGQVVRIPESKLSDLLTHAQVQVRPKLRALRDNLLIGSRVCRKGDVAYGPSLALALDQYHLGAVDILNATECGRGTLLPRKGEGGKGLADKVRVKALMNLTIGGGMFPTIAQGSVWDVDRATAETMIRAGHCAPVDWSLPISPKVRVTARRDGVRIGNRLLNKGESAVTTHDEWSDSGHCVHLAMEPVSPDPTAESN